SSCTGKLLGLSRLDSWLADITRRRFHGRPPVVVRGNHDAAEADFKRSKAIFCGMGETCVHAF
ncbi:unnamed protein product, partial [Prorocentrum cordatum]